MESPRTPGWLAVEPGDVVRLQGEELFIRLQVRGGGAGRAEVRASSPAGTHLKVVLTRGGGAKLGPSLSELGAKLVPAAPDFEDLFLARIAAEA